MAQWKKIIVSGSQAELSAVSASLGLLVGSNQQITTSQSSTFLTGSFTGSFKGDGSQLTGLVTTLNHAGATGTGTVDLLTQTFKITTGSASGINTVSSGQTVTISGINASTTTKGVASFNSSNFSVTNGAVSSNDITFNAGNGLLGPNTGLTLGETVLYSLDTGSSHFINGARKTFSVQDTSGASGINLTYNSVTGVLSGSLVNKSVTVNAGNGLTGGGTVDLGSSITLDIGAGTGIDVAANAISVDVSDFMSNGVDNRILTATGADAMNAETNLTFDSNTNVLGVQGSITTSGNVSVGGDLIVQGDLTYLNTANLFVEDKFILLNSGSANPDEAGIIVDEGSSKGHAFVFDSDTARWAFTGSLAHNATSVIPDAFVATVVDLNTVPTADTAEYQKNGNIKIDTLGEIWIYA